MNILNRWTGAVIFENNEKDLCGADLRWADLRWADLRWANLCEANLSGVDLREVDLRGANLPTNESWEDFLSIVVPALLIAGGKTLESCKEHFQCHSWNNCPMSHAFNGQSIKDVPMLLRPRVEQFIQFFDANLITWPLLARYATR